MPPLPSALVADNNKTKHCVDLPGIVVENETIWLCGLPDRTRTQLSREGVEKVLGSFALAVQSSSHITKRALNFIIFSPLVRG